MSIIVLDTSVLIPDFRLRGVLFRAVLRTAQDLRAHIDIPKLVVDEFINKYREELQNSCDSMRRYENKIRSLISSPLRERRIDVPGQVALYSDWLRGELSKSNIRSPDYPNMSHELLVKRALAKRKPFDSEGQRGYRDTVLWETILRRRARSEEIFFVSKNVRDFADPKDPHKLHPHLIEDLHSLRDCKSSVQFFDGFEDLLAHALSPRQRLFPQLLTEIENGRLGEHELKPWLVSILPGILNQVGIDELFPRDKRFAKGWVISNIRNIERLIVTSISHLTERTILVVLGVAFSADVLCIQPQSLFDEVNEARVADFISFVAVETEFETNTITSVEVHRTIPL
jgi:hypothetical protein